MYGAGAVGATIGARLFETNHDVVLIARGEHGRVLAREGLRFGTPAGWRTLKIPTVDHPRALTLGAGDIVVLSMKSQDTDDALEALAAVAPRTIPVVCAQNGVENERRALRRFANVYGMCVYMAAAYLEPGIVHIHNAPLHGICDVGRYPAGRDSIANTIAEDFAAAAIGSTTRDAIMDYKYAKLLSNLGNVLEAASGRAAGSGSLAQRAQAEAVACYRAAGIRYARDGGPSNFSFAPVEGAERGGGSTWQSVMRGAPTLESEDLNGEIVLLGRLHGVPTPVNVVLQQLAVRMVGEKLPAGSVPIDELERASSA